METPNLLLLLLNGTQYTYAKIRPYALRKFKMNQYAVRKGGGCHLQVSQVRELESKK